MNNPPPATYSVQVLGCKVNQYDGQQIEELLRTRGLRRADASSYADVMVVHTCGVTSAAAQKSRQTIRKLQREHPLASIFVTGCAAETELTYVDHPPAARIPAGADWLERLAEALQQLDLPAEPPSEAILTDRFPISQFGDQTRAFLKVQDGCDIGCSFCIIPRLRKEPRDKSIEVALKEARQLTEAGYRELVVTGVSVGLYGRETGHSLAELLRAMSQIENIGRIRLSSLHPGELTDELLEVWASSSNIMPHLHLSLQSGSDAVLQAMRRGYTAQEYLDAVERAREALDHPAFTTDVIVGFPGETDTYFEECYAFCETVGFSKMHVFTYSPRPKTMAARMGRQVNGGIAAERSARLRKLGEDMALDYHRSFLDRPVQVLVESDRNGRAMGHSEHYIPVECPSTGGCRGEILHITPQEAHTEGLKGVIQAPEALQA